MGDRQDIHDRARTAFEEGRANVAERLYLEILKENPNAYADIYNKLGIMSTEKGHLKKAVEYFQNALKINPRYTEASLNLTITLNDLGQYDEAGKIFSSAAEVVRSERKSIDPFVYGKLANEHAKLGDLYREFNLLDEAVTEYHKALSMRPEFADVLTKMGVVLREQGSFDEAIVVLKKAKRVNPGYITARTHLGIAYYMKGFLGLALEEWEAVKKINPGIKEVEAYLSLAKKQEE